MRLLSRRSWRTPLGCTYPFGYAEEREEVPAGVCYLSDSRVTCEAGEIATSLRRLKKKGMVRIALCKDKRRGLFYLMQSGEVSGSGVKSKYSSGVV
jgi:hypothetical protein